MSEVSTQGATSGEGEGGVQPTPAPASGEPATVTPVADAFATERAQLEARARDWQAKYDRLAAQQSAPAPAPTPAAPEPVDVKSVLREELRRQREIDSAVGALREQFPLAASVFDKSDSFDNVEQLKVAAENEHTRVAGLFESHVKAAVEQAVSPYVKQFGPLQTAPEGAAPGAGDGLPTLEMIERMSLSELDALEKAHPGLHRRLLDERMTSAR